MGLLTYFYTKKKSAIPNCQGKTTAGFKMFQDEKMGLKTLHLAKKMVT